MVKLIDSYIDDIEEWLSHFPEPERAKFERGDEVGEGIYEPKERTLDAGGENTILEVANQIDPPRKIVCKYKNYHPSMILEHDKKIYQEFNREIERWVRFANSRHVVQLHRTLKYISPDKLGGWWVSLGFIMEYSHLGDLNCNLRRLVEHGYRRSEILNFLNQITEAIQVGHLRKVIHGDVKPQNVLLFQGAGMPVPKVVDFGFSLTKGGDPRFYCAGTAEYLAPELWREDSFVTTEGDVYALGVLFYQVLAGNLPFVATYTANDIMAYRSAYEALHTSAMPDLGPISEKYGTEVAALTRQMLSKDPAARPQVDDVSSRLEICIIEINAQSKDPSQDAAIRPAYYCWNPDVHRLLGDELQFYILTLPTVHNATNELMHKLRYKKLFSFSLYRIIGGKDRLLRLWVRPSSEESLITILQDGFTPFLKMKVSQMESYLGRQPLEDTTADSVISGIYNASNQDNREAEMQDLSREGYILGIHKASSHFPLRLFMTISFDQQREEYYLEGFARKLKENMLRSRCVHEISWYCSDGRWREGEFQIMLKFRLAKFEDFQHAIGAFDAMAAQSINSQSYVRSQTYLEVTNEAIFENDDGSVVGEVNRHRDHVVKAGFGSPDLQAKEKRSDEVEPLSPFSN